VLRRVAAVWLLACCFLLTAPAAGSADSAGSAYAFGNLVVFDSITTDKITARSQRLLNIVVLDDRGPLHVVGRVAMPGASAYISAYADYGRQLIVLLWDRVEIYDLSDPTKPRLLQSLRLTDQGSSSPGQPLIEQAGEGKFILLNASNTTELSVESDGHTWRAAPLPPPSQAQISRMASPPESVLAFRRPTSTPLVLWESEAFRYLLAWVDALRPGEIIHRKYVRKLDKAGGRVASQLLLSREVETID
jgi:hypothetical protein